MNSLIAHRCSSGRSPNGRTTYTAPTRRNSHKEPQRYGRGEHSRAGRPRGAGSHNRAGRYARPRGRRQHPPHGAPRAHLRAGPGGEVDSEAESVGRRYFAAIDARDLDAAVALWAPGGREHVRGQVDVTAPEGVRAFIGDLLGALPDMRWEIVSTTTEGERCAVQWRFTGTFAGPGTFNGLAPTGHPLTLEGVRPADRARRA